jgi:hypothetical protein
MQPIGGIMKKLSTFGPFIPVLLIMTLIILCLPLTAYGQAAQSRGIGRSLTQGLSHSPGRRKFR